LSLTYQVGAISLYQNQTLIGSASTGRI